MIKTLNEQTVNNRFIRAATEKQLVNAKEYYDKSEEIKIQMILGG